MTRKQAKALHQGGQGCRRTRRQGNPPHRPHRVLPEPAGSAPGHPADVGSPRHQRKARDDGIGRVAEAGQQALSGEALRRCMIQEMHDNNNGDAAFTMDFRYHSNGQQSETQDPKLDELLEKAREGIGRRAHQDVPGGQPAHCARNCSRRADVPHGQLHAGRPPRSVYAEQPERDPARTCGHQDRLIRRPRFSAKRTGALRSPLQRSAPWAPISANARVWSAVSLLRAYRPRLLHGAADRLPGRSLPADRRLRECAQNSRELHGFDQPLLIQFLRLPRRPRHVRLRQFAAAGDAGDGARPAGVSDDAAAGALFAWR